MASTYTSRVRLEKQGDGENANTWGLKLNQSMIDLVDTAVAGVTAVDVDGAGGTGVVLSENDGAADQGRHFGLRMTGSLSADVTVTYTAPEKIYFVNNETIGGNNVIMNNGSTKVTVGNGTAALIATNGANSYAIRNFESGTRLAFNQNSAPVGWSVITSASHAGAGLRIVNAATSGGQVGGSNEFTSVFNTAINVSVQGSTEAATLTGNTAETTLTIAQIPPHTHSITLRDPSDTQSAFNAGSSDDIVVGSDTTGSTGGGDGHSHSLSGLGSHSHTVSIVDSFNLDVKYVNFIVCEKD